MKSIIKFSIPLFVLIFLLGCGKNNETEKYLSERENLIDASNLIEMIDSQTPNIGRSRLYVTEKYLLALDLQAIDMGIHVFDKKNFSYISSIAQKGRGPKEIVRFGDLALSTDEKEIYVSDAGKMKTFLYNIDSALEDSDYMPSVAFNLNKTMFPATFGFVNDSIIIGNAFVIESNTAFKGVIVKQNINTKQSTVIDKYHEEIDNKGLLPFVSLSKRSGSFVMAFPWHDLIRIIDYNGNVKKNIYGPSWGKEEKENSYYGPVKVGGGKIWASYIGGPQVQYDEFERPRGVNPQMIMVFKENGEYESTLDIGHGIFNFCFDSEYNRLIFYLDDQEEPLHYLELDKLNLDEI